jgi:pilus assembly protein CpaB
VRTLLQNIQVLSAGTNFQRDQEGKPEQAQVVNLLVTPAQAQILSLAGNETRIQLVLRNPMDTEISKPPEMAVSDLFGGVSVPVQPPRQESPPIRHSVAPAIVAPALVAPAAPGPYVIELSNGSVHSEAKFSSPEAAQP